MMMWNKIHFVLQLDMFLTLWYSLFARTPFRLAGDTFDRIHLLKVPLRVN